MSFLFRERFRDEQIIHFKKMMRGDRRNKKKQKTKTSLNLQRCGAEEYRYNTVVSTESGKY